MVFAAAFAAALLLSWPVLADMFQDGSNAKLPEARVNLGAVGRPPSSAAGELPSFTDLTGNLLQGSGWIDDGTRLTGPLGRTLTLRPDAGGAGGAFQTGGSGGPLLYVLPGYEDTLVVQAMPGAAPSLNTTNLQLFASQPGGPSFINFSDTSLTPPDESRLILGYDGATWVLANTLAGAGAAKNICVLDGKGAEVTACFRPRAGAGTYPDLLLGPNAPLTMSNSTVSGQALRLDPNNKLIVGQGAAGGIVFRKPLQTFHDAAATVSACGTGTPAISGDATAGFVTAGGGTVTACTVGFGFTYSGVPRAVVLTGQGTGSAVLSVAAKTVTGFTIAASASIAGQSFSYMVMQ